MPSSWVLVSALIYDYKGAEWFTRGDKTASWPFHIVYDDLHGNTFETIAQLHYSRDDKHLWIRHHEAQALRTPQTSSAGEAPMPLPPTIAAGPSSSVALPEGIVNLAWHQKANGLHINATNYGADTIRDFSLYLLDVRKYQPDRKQFVEVPEFHAKGPFAKLQLLALSDVSSSTMVSTNTTVSRLGGDTTLFSGNPVAFDFLHLDPGVTRFQGRTVDASIEMHKIQEAGIWQATLRSQVGNRHRITYLLFEWNDIAVPPKPFAFPKQVSKAPPPINPRR
jgi:hypothetical protein